MRPVLEWLVSLQSAEQTRLFGPSAESICRIVADSDFWAMLDGMAAVLTPVWDFLGWVRGCACHEDALMRGQNTPCPRKGCRGPELAAKVDMVCDQVTWACGAWSDGGSLARERMVDLGPTVVALSRHAGASSVPEPGAPVPSCSLPPALALLLLLQPTPAFHHPLEVNASKGKRGPHTDAQNESARHAPHNRGSSLHAARAPPSRES